MLLPMLIKRVQRILFLVFACVAALTLAACSSPATPEPSPSAATPTAGAVQYSTMDGWVGAVVDCLHEAGWADVVASSEGPGIDNPTLPNDQVDVYDEARIACETAAGTAPNAAPLTDEQIRAQYQHLVKAASCITNEGYSTTEPPSEQTFVDDYVSGKPTWSPFLELPKTLSQAEWEQLNVTCPQTP
jgi:hypothetical protein